ncbi:MAG: hypothetical protein ACK46L_04055 [Synechococcaceae cyanobacterium]
MAPSITTNGSWNHSTSRSHFHFWGILFIGQTTHDAQAWAESVCVSTPVRICEPLGTGKRFWFDSAVINIGDVLVVSTEGSAITLRTGQHHSAQLLLPYQGVGSWKVDRDIFVNSVGESVLYLPQAPLLLENDVTSGVALNINPVVLIRSALTMAGPMGLNVQRLGVFGQPKKLLCLDPIAGPLISSLYSIMHSLDQLRTAISNTAQLLRLDDTSIRIAVLLLLPAIHFQTRLWLFADAVVAPAPPQSVDAASERG